MEELSKRETRNKSNKFIAVCLKRSGRDKDPPVVGSRALEQASPDSTGLSATALAMAQWRGELARTLCFDPRFISSAIQLLLFQRVME